MRPVDAGRGRHGVRLSIASVRGPARAGCLVRARQLDLLDELARAFSIPC
jgi:hypothetical protein